MNPGAAVEAIPEPTAEDRALQRAEAEILAQANPLVQQAEAIVVASPEEAEAATAFASQCKRALNNIENQRTELKAPVLESGRRIDKMAKEAAAPLEEALETVKAKVLEYTTERERIAAEQEAERQKRIAEQQEAERKRLADEAAAAKAKEDAAAEEARKAQEEADKAAAENDPDAAAKQREAARKAQAEEDATLERQIAQETRPVHVTEAPVEKPANTIKSAGGGAFIGRKVLQITVVDHNRVPREYMVVDEKKLREAHKAGVGDIPGVHMEMVRSASVRAA